jgi:hypothetical protein
MTADGAEHGRVVVVGQIHTLLGRREELLELLQDMSAGAARKTCSG